MDFENIFNAKNRKTVYHFFFQLAIRRNMQTRSMYVWKDVFVCSYWTLESIGIMLKRIGKGCQQVRFCRAARINSRYFKRPGSSSKVLSSLNTSWYTSSHDIQSLSMPSMWIRIESEFTPTTLFWEEKPLIRTEIVASRLDIVNSFTN
jgi:hypothetical protein